MTVVTLEEARDRLPELVRLMASGQKVVFTDGGKWVAALAAPPPMPPTPEEEEAMRKRIKEAVEEMARDLMRNGHPVPADSNLRNLLEGGV